MQLESVGILIALRPFGERDFIAHIFTRDFGVLTGMLRGGAVAKKNKPLVGQVGNVVWNARLDSQLGVFHWESVHNLVAPIMSDTATLNFINSAFALLQTLLPECEKYERLYDDTIVLLEDFARYRTFPRSTGKPDVAQYESLYLFWEVSLLRELGYALDLTHCSGCGATENLNYLSPKTGRAVCDVCAAPYIGRLYELPLNLSVTKKFIVNICDQMSVKIPIARNLVKI